MFRHRLMQGAMATTLMIGMAGCSKANGDGPAPTEAAGTLVLKPLVVNDPVFGEEAFRTLVPANWSANGQVIWRMHPQYPSTLAVQAAEQSGLEQVHIYPGMPFADGVWYLPRGSSYLGNEIAPYPDDIVSFLRYYLLPRFRPDVVDYRVENVQTMPAWAQSSAVVAGFRSIRVPADAQAGMVRIAYEVNGERVEEEYYIMLDHAVMLGVNYWGNEWSSSVRAPDGHLNEVRGIHQAIVSSLRISLDFYNRDRQAAQMVTNIISGESATAVRISSILSHTNEQISDTIRSSYENRERVMDQVNAQFDRYIRGVEQYQNPADGGVIELPSGHRNAWVNGLGQYVLSDDPNFNPNVQMQGSWQQLQLKR